MSTPPWDMPSGTFPTKLWYLSGDDSITQEWSEDFSLPMEDDGSFGDVDIYNLKPPQRQVSFRGEGFTESESRAWTYAAQSGVSTCNITTIDGMSWSGLLKSFRRTCILCLDKYGSPLYEVEMTLRIEIPADPDGNGNQPVIGSIT